MFGNNKEKEAKLEYFAAEFDIIKRGTYVICAVTGEKIDLDELNYWNVERQEAYIDGVASYKREMQLREEG